MSPGRRIRHYRMLRGMTQKALGIAAGFSPETADIRIAQYESGVRTPKHALLCTLAEALGVSPLVLDISKKDILNPTQKQKQNAGLLFREQVNINLVLALI